MDALDAIFDRYSSLAFRTPEYDERLTTETMGARGFRQFGNTWDLDTEVSMAVHRSLDDQYEMQVVSYCLWLSNKTLGEDVREDAKPEKDLVGIYGPDEQPPNSKDLLRVAQALRAVMYARSRLTVRQCLHVARQVECADPESNVAQAMDTFLRELAETDFGFDNLKLHDFCAEHGRKLIALLTIPASPRELEEMRG